MSAKSVVGWWQPGMALVLAVLSLAGAAPAVGQSDTEELAAVQREVAALRELAFSADVDAETIGRDELRDRLISELRTTGLAEELQRSSRALAALGLVPEGTRIVPLLVQGSTVGIAGLYDPETDELLLIGRDDGELGSFEEYVAAHEFVHALQDQRLGLDQLFAERLIAQGDADLAVSALIEGDATLVEQAYLEDHAELLLGLVGATIDVVRGGLALEGAPPVYAHAGLFPYQQGAVFVRALRDAGGWEAVNDAYADPPASTEQVLHPEKYFDRDEPTALELPAAGALGTDWETVYEDTLGELQTAVLLAGQRDAADFGPLPAGARDAAAGWDGDRFALWSAGDDEVLVWRSVWDDRAEAAAFVEALREVEAERLGGEWRTTGTEAFALDGAAWSARLERDGTEVRYVVATGRTLAEGGMVALVDEAIQTRRRL